MDDVRFCPRCQEEKPLTEFYSRKAGPSSYCKPCSNAHGKQWRREQPHKLPVTIELSLSEAESGWVAGILDGEGCIYLSHAGRYHTPLVKVSNTDPRMIRRLMDLCGGNVSGGYEKRKGKDKPYWVWSASSKRAMAVLRAVLSELTTNKKEQAELVLALDFTRRGKHLTDEEISVREATRAQLTVLKQESGVYNFA